jgi:hypothetical protein
VCERLSARREGERENIKKVKKREFASGRFLRRLLDEDTKCDRVKISKSDGYRPLKLSSGCDSIIEEDGESSLHDHSRE